MPGYNHYSSCTCDWCVKYGRPNRTNRASVRQLLSTANIDCGWRCFINPNAECPVCGERVIYYENDFGSRVFFDSFGPDWKKHPCTDNRNRVTAKGLELHPADSINKLFFDEILTLGLAPSRNETWLPARVLKVDQRSRAVEIAIHDGKEWQEIELLWAYDSPIPPIGELVCLTGRRISYVRPDNLSPHTIPVRLKVLTEKPLNKSDRKSKNRMLAQTEHRRQKAEPAKARNLNKSEIAEALSRIGRVTDSDGGENS